MGVDVWGGDGEGDWDCVWIDVGDSVSVDGDEGVWGQQSATDSGVGVTNKLFVVQ